MSKNILLYFGQVWANFYEISPNLVTLFGFELEMSRMLLLRHVQSSF
jgi:hypothetical protein